MGLIQAPQGHWIWSTGSLQTDVSLSPLMGQWRVLRSWRLGGETTYLVESREVDPCPSYPPPHSRAILRGDKRWFGRGSWESIPGCEGVGKARAGESGFVSCTQCPVITGMAC